MPEELSLTEQLQRFSAGDREIADAIFRQIMPELHRIAARALREERYRAPAETGDLINELWLRLHTGGWPVSSRGHFYAIAGNVVRQVLTDFARKRLAERRGKGETVLSLDDPSVRADAAVGDFERFVQMSILMDRLAKQNAEVACVVDLHYVVGYTHDEVVERTGLSLSQVRTHWKRGSDWLKDRL